MADRRPVLVDPVLDEQLRRDGLAVVPTLEADDVQHLKAAYWATVPGGEDGIRLDFLRDDRQLVRALDDLVVPVWNRVAPRVLVEHRPIYSSFVVKHPGPDSALALHRDMTVDDERQRPAYALWMPLDDTSPDLDNGPLSFVRGSQDLPGGQCGPNTVMAFIPYESELRARLEPLTVPAGHAVVYDARMLHASAPNRSLRPRLALGCLLSGGGRAPIQVVATGRRHRAVHQVDRDYFLTTRPEDVTRSGMSGRYPIIDEYDDPPIVDTPTFLGSAFGGPATVRAVVVPPDLVAQAGDAAPLDLDRGFWPATHDRDLDIATVTLGHHDGEPVGGSVLESHFAAAHLPLVDGTRRTPPPAWLPDVGDLLDAQTVRADVIVAGPHGRVVITPPAEPPTYSDLVVIECTPVRTGACTRGHATELDLGLRLPLEPGRPLTIWNEGPGALVAVLRQRRSPEPNRTVRSALMRRLRRPDGGASRG